MFAKLFCTSFRLPIIACKQRDACRLLQGMRCLSIKSEDVIKFPRTPYMIFSNGKISEVRKSHPNIQMPEVMKLIGQMWRNMSEDEKNLFNQHHQAEKDHFHEQYSEEDRRQMLQQRRQKRLEKKARKLKTLQKVQGKPLKTGVNPYLLFANSKMLERGDASLTMYIQGVSDLWKKMPEEDKQPFVTEAHRRSLEYKKDMVRWEERMIKEGKLNLLPAYKLRLYKLLPPSLKKPSLKTKAKVEAVQRGKRKGTSKRKKDEKRK